MREAQRIPTVRDVARAANVSVATVSRALAGKTVRPESRRRVDQATRSLGYRPNLAARSLRTREYSSLGVILPTMADPFWASVGEEIVEGAAATGVSTIVASTSDDAARVEVAVSTFMERRVNAILAVGMLVAPPAFERAAEEIPCVVLNRDLRVPRAELVAVAHAPFGELEDPDRRVGEPAYSTVRTDDSAATGRLVQHLLDRGHSQLGFCGGEATESALRRIWGFRRALEGSGARCVAIDLGGDSPQAGYAAGRRLWADIRGPVALIGASDMTAMGLLRAAHDAGRRVPADVAVAGIDGLQIAEYLEPPLTTVRQRTAQIASVALDMVARRVGVETSAEWILVPGDLVERASTCAPNS